MYFLRPAALRLLPSSRLFLAKPRSIVTVTPSVFRLTRLSSRIAFQKRWNSDWVQKAAPESELTSQDEDAPKSVDESDSRTVASAVESATEFATESTTSETLRERSESTETAAAGEVRPRTLFSRRNYDSNKLFENAPKETVYVGNLFFDVTADDLKRDLSKFGVVEHVTLIHDSRGLSKGFGYVTFDSIDNASRAIDAMHMVVYEGRRLVVQYAQSNPRTNKLTKEPTKTLYVGNLAFDLTDADLNDIFKDIRNVIDVRVAVDRKTGQPRGFAHADFIDVASAKVAYEVLASKAPGGRRLRLDYSYHNKGRLRRDPSEDVDVSHETQDKF